MFSFSYGMGSRAEARAVYVMSGEHLNAGNVVVTLSFSKSVDATRMILVDATCVLRRSGMGFGTRVTIEQPYLNSNVMLAIRRIVQATEMFTVVSMSKIEDHPWGYDESIREMVFVDLFSGAFVNMTEDRVFMPFDLEAYACDGLFGVVNAERLGRENANMVARELGFDLFHPEIIEGRNMMFMLYAYHLFHTDAYTVFGVEELLQLNQEPPHPGVLEYVLCAAAA